MKTLIATLVLLLATNAQAHLPHPWDWAVGCYSTVERNGFPVPKSPDFEMLTTFEVKDAMLIVDLDGHQIPSLEMMIMQKFTPEDGVHHFDVQNAFTEKGRYSKDSNGYHFEFSGRLRLHPAFCQGSCEGDLYSKITLVPISPEVLGMKVVRVVPQFPDQALDSNDTYIFKKVSCEQWPAIKR